MTTIHDLVEKTAEYESDRSDTIASSKNLGFGYPVMTWREPAGLFNDPSIISAGILQPIAAYQVAQRLNAPPVSWLYDDDDCPSYFRDEILNKLAKIRDESNLLVRCKSDKIRAVLSDQYSIFDSDRFTQILEQAILTTPHLAELTTKVMRPQYGDHFKAYVIFPDATWGDDPRGGGNSPLHPAIHISNNSVGQGMFRVNSALFSGFCNNGAIFGWRTTEEMAMTHRWFHDEVIMIRAAASMIATALRMTEAATQMYLDSFNVEYKPVEVDHFLDLWAKKGALTERTKGSWEQFVTLEANNRGTSVSLGDLVNGLTALAQTGNDASETEKMERLAGDMLMAEFTRAANRQMAFVEA